MELLVFGDGLLGSAFKNHGVVLSHEDCDITSRFDIDAVLTKYKPKVVVNCAGIVPKAETDIITTLRVNSQAPKLIAAACDEIDARLVQISTDCVFSGNGGKYLEVATPDPDTTYGFSKYLGEITEFPHLTVRTSFIGFPDVKGRGLLAWAAQQKVITGYDKVLWNGLTVNELVKVLIETVIPMELSNVIHLYGETVSKYDILKEFKFLYGFDYQLIKESEVEENTHVSDKTLTSMLPEIQTTKTFKEMMQEMKDGVV